MTVIKRMKHKKKDGSIIEADIGALAKNVEQDENHRFVTDNEKKAWNEKPSKDGDIAETKVSILEESKVSFPEPAAGDKQRTLWGKVKKWQQDCLVKFGNYVLMSMITNQHLNSTNNIPTSALVYLMQQAIQQNQSAINVLNTKLYSTYLGITVHNTKLQIIQNTWVFENGVAYRNITDFTDKKFRDVIGFFAVSSIEGILSQIMFNKPDTDRISATIVSGNTTFSGTAWITGILAIQLI